MSEPNDCPRLMEAHRLWEGELEGRHAVEVRRHRVDCSSCRAATAEWDRLSGLLVRGDPAAGLAPERRQRMRAELLAACTATLAEPSGAVEQGMSRPPLRPGRRPLRIALALVPVALTALWGFHALHRAPSGHAGPDTVVSRPPVPVQIPGLSPAPVQDKTHLRGFTDTRRRRVRPTREGGFRLVQTGVSNPGAGRFRPRHSGKGRSPFGSPRLAVRLRRALRVAAVPPHQSPVPTHHHRPVAQVAAPAADPPIERLVIQADAPRPIAMKTITHLTVIAAGDLKAPGAQLTIVKSQKEEALP